MHVREAKTVWQKRRRREGWWSCAGEQSTVTSGCDHVDCHLGHFVIVFLDSNTGVMRVHLYWSDAAAWSQPMYGPQATVHGVEALPTALVGNALYFLIDATQSILECDLATMNMS